MATPQQHVQRGKVRYRNHCHALGSTWRRGTVDRGVTVREQRVNTIARATTMESTRLHMRVQLAAVLRKNALLTSRNKVRAAALCDSHMARGRKASKPHVTLRGEHTAVC